MNKYQHFLTEIKKRIPIGESFDIKEREIIIGGRVSTLFFIDGLTNSQIVQMVISHLLRVTEESSMNALTLNDFVKHNMPFHTVMLENDMDVIIKNLYSGLMPVLIDGYDKIAIIDMRNYPARAVDEPSKEKSLRGAKDGFTETLMINIALVRRRLRDDNLIFKAFEVGKMSKTDVSLVYMEDKANLKIVERLSKHLQELDLGATTVGDQTMVEALVNMQKRKNYLNPFPKVRYTQRPDVVSAHVAEGKIAILTDNSPTAILIPAGIFDFLQDVDDYYFPLLTGNYFRLLRIINLLVIMFLTPVYLLVSQGDIYIPINDKFFVPKEEFAISIFWQFILLEFAIDGLKLASLNTPESLGMSLSVIGALLLGEFSISSGWFIPQTILCMAIVALASFTQPSIELGYGMKFMRILILIGAYIYGVTGAVTALIISLLWIAATKTISGTSYLYPLIPFHWHSLKKLIFRTKK